MNPTVWRAWAPEAGGAAAVLVLGLLQAASGNRPFVSVLAVLVLLLGLAAALLLVRRAPGASLVLVWLVALGHVVAGVPVLTVELAVAVVAFGCARWGSPATVVLGGVSIPVAALVGGWLLVTGRVAVVADLGVLRGLVLSVPGPGRAGVVGGLAVLGASLLALPWLGGLVVRAVSRARRSEGSRVAAEQDAARAHRESEQAREIARLREAQARLATDVHDVVGHSLAVILAQAESAQFLPDDDPAALKATLATVATSARTSLQDVRAVLTATQPVPRPGGLDQLVEGVRASGHEIVSYESGTAQPLPPELEVVAFHVLQEMLTNAVRHGRRGEPVVVERHWPQGRHGDDLRIEVGNGVDPERQDTDDGAVRGQGLDGMRRRLESVGGRLDVRPRETSEGPTFTVTAWVPVRPRGGSTGDVTGDVTGDMMPR